MRPPLRPTIVRRSLLLAVLVAALTACGGADDDDAAGTVPPVPTADEPSPTTEATPSSTAPAPPSVVLNTTVPGSALPAPPAPLPPGETDLDRAIADVIEHTGVDRAAVVVAAEEEVTWPDSAVGCPQKGMQYLQVLTEGARIVLEVDGQQYHYHRGGNRDLFYCAAPTPGVGE